MKETKGGKDLLTFVFVTYVMILFVGVLFILMYSSMEYYDLDSLKNVSEKYCFESGYDDYSFRGSDYFYCYKVIGDERIGIKKDYDLFYFLKEEKDERITKNKGSMEGFWEFMRES